MLIIFYETRRTSSIVQRLPHTGQKTALILADDLMPNLECLGQITMYSNLKYQADLARTPMGAAGLVISPLAGEEADSMAWPFLFTRVTD